MNNLIKMNILAVIPTPSHTSFPRRRESPQTLSHIAFSQGMFKGEVKFPKWELEGFLEKITDTLMRFPPSRE
jgi:hypothetical protein